jgi:hypothetical protein
MPHKINGRIVRSDRLTRYAFGNRFTGPRQSIDRAFPGDDDWRYSLYLAARLCTLARFGGYRMPDVIASATVVTAEPRTGVQPVPQDRADPDQLPMGVVVRLTAYIFLFGFALLYLLIKIWPGTVPPADQSTVTLGWDGKLQLKLWIETRYLLIVALSGAIGSFIHVATSFADFVGNRKLRSSWEVWYFMRPLIGASLALVVYFVIRGGLISSSGGPDPMSPYGLAATAGMCGLFSQQASDKLQEIFEEAFRTKDRVERSDPLSPEPQTAEIRVTTGAGSQP